MTPLKVLLVEDSAEDADLLFLQLRRSGFEVTSERVETAEALRLALQRERWDIMLADYRLPRFSGPAALEVLRETGLDLPFILLSGTVGEEAAAAIMRAGARDFLLKQNIGRLSAVVSRELREAEIRHKQRRADASQRFLARATAVMASSIEYETTLQNLAGLLVPEVADGCVIDFLEETSERLKSVVVSHVNPEQRQLLRDLSARSEPCGRGPRAVARTGRPELYPQITEALLADLAADEEHRQALRAAALCSALVVPMVARGKILGAITLVSAASGRSYDEVDLAFAGELARAIAIAIDNARLYEQAQVGVRVRDEFLSVAAHELRTPLTSIGLQVATLAKQLERAPIDAPARARLLGSAEKAAQATGRLGRLVDGLLDVSRINAGRLELHREEIDLAGLARQIMEHAREEALRFACDLRLQCNGEVKGYWDPLRLEQVITNLVSNALKYGHGHPVVLTIGKSERAAILSVVDHGIGIPPEDMQRIFEPFERAAPSRHYGGLGLGLYITRQILTAHGGSIRVQARPEGGSEFIVELPLSPFPGSPAGTVVK